MCTNIAEKAPTAGSGKGPEGWFALDHVYLGYDHPVHAQLEHAVSIDFVNEAAGPGARVAVELSRDAARDLVARLSAVLERADAHEDPR